MMRPSSSVGGLIKEAAGGGGGEGYGEPEDAIECVEVVEAFGDSVVKEMATCSDIWVHAGHMVME